MGYKPKWKNKTQQQIPKFNVGDKLKVVKDFWKNNRQHRQCHTGKRLLKKGNCVIVKKIYKKSHKLKVEITNKKRKVVDHVPELYFEHDERHKRRRLPSRRF